MHILIVIDMQNDFIYGSLGTESAASIIPTVTTKIAQWEGGVIFTRDTHDEQYLQSQEGQMLPVVHCVKGSPGWEIVDDLVNLAKHKDSNTVQVIDKGQFGTLDLIPALQDLQQRHSIESITFIGVCTDICVVSNALIVKAAFPEIPISVDADCCAGSSEERHQAALETMRSCQITVI